jgi:hypothetical protein
VGDWTFGDESKHELGEAPTPVNDADGSRFWARGATRPRKILVLILILFAAAFVAWHVYELVVGFRRALG